MILLSGRCCWAAPTGHTRPRAVPMSSLTASEGSWKLPPGPQVAGSLVALAKLPLGWAPCQGCPWQRILRAGSLLWPVAFLGEPGHCPRVCRRLWRVFHSLSGQQGPEGIRGSSPQFSCHPRALGDTCASGEQPSKHPLSRLLPSARLSPVSLALQVSASEQSAVVLGPGTEP